MFYKIYENCKKFIVENYKFLLVLLAIVLLFKIELPYIIYKPGGSINLNDRIEIEGGYDTEGSFEMAYVSVVKGSLPFLALAKIIPNWDIAPKDEIAYDNESIKDALERDKIYLEEAYDNATFVAYTLASKDVEIEKTYNNVIYITDEAETTISIYDKVLEADNKPITSLMDLKTVVNERQAGDIIKVKVLRDGKEKLVDAKVYQSEDDLKIGVSVVNTYDIKTKPEVEIKTKASESGPSGGLMTALSIYNALTKEDLTKGRKIIGTGTINMDGTVGEIGGVKYKIMGAEKKGADIFLCPKDNYKEALEVVEDKNYNIKVVSVEHIEDAIYYLKNN